MENNNLRPFLTIALVVAVLFIIGFGILAIFGGTGCCGGWGPGMWGMGFFWIFPVLGFVLMLTMMFFMFSTVFRRGGPMDWMWGDRTRDEHHYMSKTKNDLRCPSCDSSIRADWNVCPQCGTSLKEH